jgi:hypothetical protein
VLLVGAVVVAVAAGAGIVVTRPFGGSGTRGSGVIDNAAPASLATVTRQNLSSQINVNATLGYAGDYSVVNQAQGTITALPGVGHVVRQGQVLYRVNGAPVVLLYGRTPAYRNLAEGTSASDVTGPDVAQLNNDLAALGYPAPAGSDEFSWQTKVAVEDFQADLGVRQSGALPLGQVVFLPSAARITAAQGTLGGPAQPGQPVLKASSTARRVTIALDAAQQSEVKAGDGVTITLPSGRTTPGVVSSVGTVATAGGGSGGSAPTVTVEITPTNPAATGTVDQAPVQVSITTGTAAGVLVVPVNALVALSSGGYAVEEVAAHRVHHLVPVTTGLFDDAAGLVQVSGPGLAAGQHVVVPAS